MVGVEDVFFKINSGEMVCVVGELGLGKLVLFLFLMWLVEFGGGDIVGGWLLFDCVELG